MLNNKTETFQPALCSEVSRGAYHDSRALISFRKTPDEGFLADGECCDASGYE